jgi:hypothetical protein
MRNNSKNTKYEFELTANSMQHFISKDGLMKTNHKAYSQLYIALDSLLPFIREKKLFSLYLTRSGSK